MTVAEDVDLDQWAARLAAPGQNFSGRDIHVGLCKQAKYSAFKRWQGGRSQAEIVGLARLASNATQVTNEDIEEVLKQVPTPTAHRRAVTPCTSSLAAVSECGVCARVRRCMGAPG